jgi:hypothetical protein
MRQYEKEIPVRRAVIAKGRDPPRRRRPPFGRLFLFLEAVKIKGGTDEKSNQHHADKQKRRRQISLQALFVLFKIHRVDPKADTTRLATR